MLTTLRIKNLALVADLTLELQPGYNVITGETGTGKSILIGALNLALGERADRTLIRSGSDNCSVEAVFEITRLQTPIKGFLEENGLEPCEDNQLVLKRTFTLSGANRQFINGSPTSLSTLATLGEWLVDIHGPHEHQSLLRPASQLAMLDAFGKLEPERDAFGQLLRRRAALEQEKAALIVDEKTYAQQLDLLRFQTAEITNARLQPDEEAQLEQEYNRAGNVAKLLQLGQSALDLLTENETSLLAQAGIIGRTLQELQRIDAGAASITQLQDQSVATLRELQGKLSRYIDRLEVDPARLRQLEERLNLLQSLKRKYGPSLTEVIAFGSEAQRKLQSLESRDTELGRLNAGLDELDREILRAGQSLSARRKKLAPMLAKAVSKQLMDLGFKQSRFDVSLGNIDLTGLSGNSSKTAAAGQASKNDSAEPGQGGSAGGRWALTGFDTVEFLFAPNPGEPRRALRAIASSGELARVMLAIKTVLAAEDRIPVLVFDEVDANVGGETAHTVGEKMQQIARQRQVLCITHLPQVAAPAAAHFVACKQIKTGRTISEISLLGPEERVTELARMLGGQSEAARKHAEALLR